MFDWVDAAVESEEESGANCKKVTAVVMKSVVAMID